MLWRSVLLGEVCGARSSLVDPTAPANRDLPHIPPNSIERDTGRLLGFRTAAEDGVTSGKYRFEAGDLLYSKIRPNLNKAALVNFPGVCSADMYALELDRRKVVPEYLVRLLRTSSFLEYATSHSNRANIPKLNRNQLLAFRFDLPSVEVQRRIADILDRADALRAKRDETLVYLDDLTESIFLDMFGEPTINDRGWPASQVSDFVAGFESGKNLVADDADNRTATHRVLKVSAVTAGRFRPEESKALPSDYVPPARHLVKDGDLLFSRANTTELIGATALVTSPPEKLALPDKLWRFVWHTEPRANPVWVWHLFQRPAFRREVGRRATGTSGSMQNISQPKVLSIAVGLPPLSEQREFAARGAAIERARQARLSGSESLDLLFASLQHRAFTGDL